MESLVSILIPAYNAEKWLTETVNSALSQTWPYIEIIIVDDGSQDNTLLIAKEFRGKGVKVVTQTNSGASSARNRAFKESSGDYIQYLDADDLLAPDKIEKQLLFLQKFEDNVISSSSWGMFTSTPDEALLKPTKLWADFLSPVDWLLTAWTDGCWMQPTGWLCPRKLIELAGPWDEELSLHDDGEFFCRVLLKSKGVKFCRDAKSYYRKGILNSLSSQKGIKAVKSHFRICELYEQHIMSIENSTRTRKACANNYQNFIYTYYPKFSNFIKEAENNISKLGGTNIAPGGSSYFKLLSKVLGWKLARRLELIVYSVKSIKFHLIHFKQIIT